MAVRPVFEANEEKYVKICDTEFEFYSGFSRAQKQRSIDSLHMEYEGRHQGKRVLEISGYSKEQAGAALSAFSLTKELKDGRKVPVELIFQAGKKFENGGPYRDLLAAAPGAAKSDERLRTSGRIVSFEFDGRVFPTEPETLAYTWLYIAALSEHEELADELIKYDAFTDIAFNPARSINCQAYAAAVFVSLKKKGELETALSDTAFLAQILAPSAGEMAGRTVPSQPAARQRRKAAPKKKKDAELARSQFQIRDAIVHPVFGNGIVKKVNRTESTVQLVVAFESGGEKKLSEAWVLENCRRE